MKIPWIILSVLGPIEVLSLAPLAEAATPVEMRQVEVPVRFVDYRFAVQRGDNGVPRFDWERFRSRPEQIVSETWQGIELENTELKVVIIPGMGRVHSLVHKPTNKEQLWINRCARPLPAHNDTGYWMTWGGIERVLPRGEHGTTHALVWEHELTVDDESQKSIRCQVTEPLTGLRHALQMTLFADRPYLETRILVENSGETAVRYSQWTTAVWAPGGEGELLPETELIVPADHFIPDDRPFNAWMQQFELGARSSPLRWLKQWSSTGDLMTSPLWHPYYAIYAHDANQGVVHMFDLDATPTVDVWCWGYPATAKHQGDFTACPPNRGYVEVWNGNVANFRDESLATLLPGARLQWVEQTFCVSGLLGQAADLRKAIDQLAARHRGRPAGR